MAEYKATLHWTRAGGDFLPGRYSREHTWSFDGGVTVPASASPSVVPVPYANPACVDPEEAFVAAISSCHLLTFLFLAGRAGFVVDAYQDTAVGVMTPNAAGIPWVSRVTLQPVVIYGGEKPPTPAEEAELHRRAHEQCYIANSIKTEIRIVNGRPTAELSHLT